jgi:hypothetical protein
MYEYDDIEEYSHTSLKISCDLRGSMIVANIYIYMYICIYVYMYICIYVYMYICICICICICIHIHLHGQTYIHAHVQMVRDLERQAKIYSIYFKSLNPVMDSTTSGHYVDQEAELQSAMERVRPNCAMHSCPSTLPNMDTCMCQHLRAQHPTKAQTHTLSLSRALSLFLSFLLSHAHTRARRAPSQLRLPSTRATRQGAAPSER